MCVSAGIIVCEFGGGWDWDACVAGASMKVYKILNLAQTAALTLNRLGKARGRAKEPCSRVYMYTCQQFSNMNFNDNNDNNKYKKNI